LCGGLGNLKSGKKEKAPQKRKKKTTMKGMDPGKKWGLPNMRKEKRRGTETRGSAEKIFDPEIGAKTVGKKAKGGRGEKNKKSGTDY